MSVRTGGFAARFLFIAAEKGEKELSAERILCVFLCVLLSLR